MSPQGHSGGDPGRGTWLSSARAHRATDTLLEYTSEAGITLRDSAMNDPAEIARFALDGLEAGELEILDRLSAEAKASLGGPPQTFDLRAVASA